jgi:uncharacterized protein
LLDDDFAHHLGEYRFLVGVSLDGPSEIHDSYRRTEGGKGSHADVWRGIAALKRHHVEFNILTLVSQANVRSPALVYRHLRDSGFLFHQYIECVEFDRTGQRRPFSISGEEWGAFLCGLYDAWRTEDVRTVSIRLFDSILALLVENTANVCHMGQDCRQYFVVEYNGDVYPCDFYVEPEWRLGNVMSDSWESLLDSPRYAEFGRRKALRNEACGTCEYVQLCAGDCQKNRPGNARDSRQVSELCKGWKMFYRHSLAGFQELAAQIRKQRSETGCQPPASGRNAGRGPGRNDPCPCGAMDRNGRPIKYKKCHGK